MIDELHLENFGKNTNVILSLLAHYVWNFIPFGKRKIYIQADNAPVNKSKYLIAFGKLLIDKFLFNEVEINFMIPGHTKFSPDRSFGTFKNELRKNEVLNI